MPPKLHDLNPPPAFGEKITYITLLPWFAVQDDTMAEADRILKSPVYSLNRTDVYKLLMNQYNDTRVDQKVRYTMMTGVSHDTTEEFAHSVGIELGAEYTIVPKVLTGSVKLTYNFTYTSSSTDHMETQKTYELELTIPAGTNAAVYMIESTYQLRRQDGTLVSNVTPDYGVPSSSYTTQYPPASDTQPAVTQSEPRLLKA